MNIRKKIESWKKIAVTVDNALELSAKDFPKWLEASSEEGCEAITFVRITPQLAKLILEEHNFNNRKMKTMRRVLMKKAMKNKRWFIHNQGLGLLKLCSSR
ncbi:MAG: hypothetical protein AAGM67_06935, partial [Bacteroidota bacterium]